MTVRVGVIGVGVMGADHARKLARTVSGSELVSVTDFEASLAQTLAKELDARIAPDGYAVIDDPGVDAVVVATRDDTHADLVLAALRAGKPVLCEKPLAPTAVECRASRFGDRFRQLAARSQLGELGWSPGSAAVSSAHRIRRAGHRGDLPQRSLRL